MLTDSDAIEAAQPLRLVVRAARAPCGRPAGALLPHNARSPARVNHCRPCDQWQQCVKHTYERQRAGDAPERQRRHRLWPGAPSQQQRRVRHTTKDRQRRHISLDPALTASGARNSDGHIPMNHQWQHIDHRASVCDPATSGLPPLWLRRCCVAGGVPTQAAPLAAPLHLCLCSCQAHSPHSMVSKAQARSCIQPNRCATGDLMQMLQQPCLSLLALLRRRQLHHAHPRQPPALSANVFFGTVLRCLRACGTSMCASRLAGRSAGGLVTAPAHATILPARGHVRASLRVHRNNSGAGSVRKCLLVNFECKSVCLYCVSFLL